MLQVTLARSLPWVDDVVCPHWIADALPLPDDGTRHAIRDSPWHVNVLAGATCAATSTAEGPGVSSGVNVGDVAQFTIRGLCTHTLTMLDVVQCGRSLCVELRCAARDEHSNERREGGDSFVVQVSA